MYDLWKTEVKMSKWFRVDTAARWTHCHNPRTKCDHVLCLSLQNHIPFCHPSCALPPGPPRQTQWVEGNRYLCLSSPSCSTWSILWRERETNKHSAFKPFVCFPTLLFLLIYLPPSRNQPGLQAQVPTESFHTVVGWLKLKSMPLYSWCLAFPPCDRWWFWTFFSYVSLGGFYQYSTENKAGTQIQILKVYTSQHRGLEVLMQQWLSA